LFFSNHSRIPFIYSLCSTMKSIGFSSICGPGFNSTPPIINVTAFIIQKTTCAQFSIYYCQTVHRHLARSCTEEINSGRVRPCVHSHFTLVPTCLHSVTSQLQLRVCVAIVAMVKKWVLNILNVCIPSHSACKANVPCYTVKCGRSSPTIFFHIIS
jgi:hypothetical protein